MNRRTNRLWGQRLRLRAIGVDSMTLARLAARRSLMDRAGFRRLLPGDLSGIVAPQYEVSTPSPDHTTEKMSRHLPCYFVLSLGVHSFPGGFGPTKMRRCRI